jgi:hypothetical protein
MGMSESKVVTMLGQPCSKDPGCYGSNSFMLTYTPDARLACSPMLWVHFQDNVVVEVYAKRYPTFSFDDVAVYGSNYRQPTWEGTLFTDTFPNP